MNSENKKRQKKRSLAVFAGPDRSDGFARSFASQSRLAEPKAHSIDEPNRDPRLLQDIEELAAVHIPGERQLNRRAKKNIQ